jgi:ferredoxin-type protein NapH
MVKKAWYVTKRLYIQIGGVVLLNISILMPWAKGICVPVLHCYGCPVATFACPIGTLQYFITAAAFPFIVLALMIAVGVFLGKLLCFYLCPFGFFQDILFRLNKTSLRMPPWLEYGKYVFLFLVAGLLSVLLSEPIFCKICPAGALESGIPLVLHARMFEPVISGPLGTFRNPILSMVGPLFWTKVAILAAVIGAALCIRRPFCRVMCPAGAVFVLFSKVSTLHLRFPGPCRAHQKKQPADEKRIGAILCEYGIISPDELARALEEQKKEGGKIGEVLIALGYIENDDVIIGLSEQNYSVDGLRQEKPGSEEARGQTSGKTSQGFPDV